MTKKNRLVMKESGAKNTSVLSGVGDIDDEDNAWDFDEFKRGMELRIISMDEKEMEFDLIGIDASVANAIRRIIIADVPSMAIEKVIINQNTSLIQDEVLAHRLGLIPLKADPKVFTPRQFSGEDGEIPEVVEGDTLEFELKVKCTMNSGASRSATDPDIIFKNHKVVTSHMKWIPCGLQRDMFREEDVGPISPDILIAKMRPGQEIDCKMLAIKGIGRDHAKFMPATVWYRLLPQIEMKERVEGERAYRLSECFSPGVVKVEEDAEGTPVARVVDARYDTCSRNVLLHDDLRDTVVMSKVLDHFIFNVESHGAQKPNALVAEAMKIMMAKCSKFLEHL